MSEKPAFYRNRIGNLYVWVITVISALLILVLLLDAIAQPHPSPVAMGLAVILIAALSIPAVRVPRRGVSTTSTEIVIRTILHTYVLRWEELESFEVSTPFFYGRYGVAVLKNGRRIRMTGVASGFVDRYAEHAVSKLNAQLAETGRRQ